MLYRVNALSGSLSVYYDFTSLTDSNKYTMFTLIESEFIWSIFFYERDLSDAFKRQLDLNWEGVEAYFNTRVDASYSVRLAATMHFDTPTGDPEFLNSVSIVIYLTTSCSKPDRSLFLIDPSNTASRRMGN